MASSAGGVLATIVKSEPLIEVPTVPATVGDAGRLDVTTGAVAAVTVIVNAWVTTVAGAPVVAPMVNWNVPPVVGLMVIKPVTELTLIQLGRGPDGLESRVKLVPPLG